MDYLDALLHPLQTPLHGSLLTAPGADPAMRCKPCAAGDYFPRLGTSSIYQGTSVRSILSGAACLQPIAPPLLQRTCQRVATRSWVFAARVWGLRKSTYRRPECHTLFTLRLDGVAGACMYKCCALPCRTCVSVYELQDHHGHAAFRHLHAVKAVKFSQLAHPLTCVDRPSLHALPGGLWGQVGLTSTHWPSFQNCTVGRATTSSCFAIPCMPTSGNVLAGAAKENQHDVVCDNFVDRPECCARSFHRRLRQAPQM